MTTAHRAKAPRADQTKVPAWCACGWKGYRRRSDDRACSECGQTITVQPCATWKRQQQIATKRAELDARIAASQAAARTARAAEDARALEFASALLRADTEHLRPARKPEP
jgi:hypothetical protein